MVAVFDGRELMARRERLDRELGLAPENEDALERWQRLQPKPEPRERKLDTAPPTMVEVDQRIDQRSAAEHEWMMALLAEVIALVQSEMAAGPPGPPGPPGPAGPPGAPGKLPVVKLWTPE